MGYNTDFRGKFELNKKLDDYTFDFLKDLNTTRRTKRNIGPEFGIEGEFYFKDDDVGIIDNNKPPSTQPGLWCQWTPVHEEDKDVIEWDGGEKFYDYIEWIEYIISKILEPKGYILNGNVCFNGEEANDYGVINIVNNNVTVG